MTTGTHAPPAHVSPAPQHAPHPQSVVPGAQMETQAPPTHVSPQPHAGSQVVATHVSELSQV